MADDIKLCLERKKETETSMSVVFFAQFNEENFALSEHTCLTNHTIGWDESKTITTNRRHQRLCLETGISTQPTLVSIVTMAAYYLTPIYTSLEKRAAN